MPDNPPRVFISYSHDDPDHKKWVAMLGGRLREKGVDAVLDQWDLRPGKDVAVFMEEQLAACDFALLICSARYVEKANSGEGGVGYEKMIVSGAMIKDMDAGKFIPVIRNPGDNKVPRFIETKLYLDFTNDEFFESVFDDLLRTLLSAEIASKPPLGEVPEFDIETSPAQRGTTARHETGLTIEAFEMFEFMVRQYDSGMESEWDMDENSDFENLSLGRIAREVAFQELIQAKLLVHSFSTYYTLSNAAKSVAQKLKII